MSEKNNESLDELYLIIKTIIISAIIFLIIILTWGKENNSVNKDEILNNNINQNILDTTLWIKSLKCPFYSNWENICSSITQVNKHIVNNLLYITQKLNKKIYIFTKNNTSILTGNEIKKGIYNNKNQPKYDIVIFSLPDIQEISIKKWNKYKIYCKNECDINKALQEIKKELLRNNIDKAITWEK